MSWCAPRCTAPFDLVRKARSASSTASGFCDVAPESKYANWFPPRITRLRIGKSARILATSVGSNARTEVVMSGSGGRGLREALVAVLLELVGGLGAARLDDPALDEH